jgi:hypothetical protein
MYINKVDDIIDKVIDEFSVKIIMNNKIIKVNLIKEQNFIKYQKDINNILIDYIKTIPMVKIKEIVKKGDSINAIFNTLKKYVIIYLFLFIGFNYKFKDDTFINNIIEFSKNQVNYDLKIDNFFNSVSNASLIKYYYMIKNLLFLFDQGKLDLSSIEKLSYGKETVDFLMNFDDEFIKQNFMTSNKQDQAHNIIKTIIIFLIYRIEEKKEFYKLLELSETENREYTFIDVVYPVQQYIDFSTVENLLSKNDVIDGLAYDLWDYLENIELINSQSGYSTDEKILEMINEGFIIPIVDDFLLYHKDTERYDKNVTDVKKKDDTKIQYILNKVDMVSDFYSNNAKKDPKLLKNITKNFHPPLYDRKGVLRNDYEEIKIINKFLNQGRKNLKNIEYLNDLSNYRDYPFINFKDFKDDGFGLICNKTINVVRSVSFEKEGKFKQYSSNRLQFRVGSDNMHINIVGFLIPSGFKHMKCLKVNEPNNIRKKYNDNSLDFISEYIKKNIVNNKSKRFNKSGKSVYWLFNTEFDKVVTKTYENPHNSKQDLIKLVLSELYDRLVTNIYYQIYDEIESRESITLQEADKILNRIQKRLLPITQNKKYLEKIEELVYSKKLLTSDETYDKNDDKLFGLTGKVYELEVNPLEVLKSTKRLTIDPEKLDETGEVEMDEIVVGICQHNITWDDIAAEKRTDPKSYMEDIFKFIKQYVIENSEGIYTCKSCGFQLTNIKKYLTDGVFDSDTKQFITYSMPMEVSLEDIPEYSKYRPSIKILDKIVEKISSITNISHLIGSSTSTKWKRKGVIKNVIDLLLINTSYLKYKFKERNERTSKKYEISRNISNLFVFDLENSIFQFSSKDVDKYKVIKMNNIIAYIVMNLLLDLNETHIAFLSSDKKYFCDFELFDKYYKVLYGNIKFLKNSENDTVNVTNYKIFCYALYMISCKLAKHRLWSFESDITKVVSKKKIPLMQKSVIHTVIDLINSILENSFKKDTKYELEMFRTKFYERLGGIFSNNDLYNNLKREKLGWKIQKNEKVKDVKVNIKMIDAHYDRDRSYNIETKFRSCTQHRYYMPYGLRITQEFSKLNILTNCKDGRFHSWKVDNKTFTCKICNIKMNNLLDNTNNDIDITNKFILKNLSELAKIYCNSGVVHQFIDDNKSGRKKCTKCGELDNKIYKKNELLIMEKNIRKHQLKVIEKNKLKLTKQIEREDTTNEYIKKIISRTYDKLNKTIKNNNELSYVVDFINNLEKIIGNDKNILKNTKLKDNIYIIDHDHLGYSLKNNIIITDSDKKIFYKENHKYFKTNVLYYTDYTSGKIEVFYDSITKILLGYKEEAKNYVNHTGNDRTLKINYSIENKIKLLGYESQYLNIDEKIKDLLEYYKPINLKDSRDKLYKLVIKNIIKDRHNNLKKYIFDFHRVFNRIINNTPPNVRQDNDDSDNTYYFSNRLNGIINKYVKKLYKMKFVDDNSKNRVLKHWKGVVRGINMRNMDDIYFDKDSLINVDTLTTYDKKGNILLFYLINEMNNLINFNNNKFTKILIVTFLIDFINTSFDAHNIEHLLNNKDIRRFTYVLKSTMYFKDLEEREDVFNQGIYEEYTEQDEEIDEEDIENREDSKQESVGLDVERDVDDEEYDNTLDSNDGVDYQAIYDRAVSGDLFVDTSNVKTIQRTINFFDN